MQVAVVGAGVAGLASAIALRHAGAAVTVFERRSGPATGGAGVLLQPSGLAALAAIGGALGPESPAICRLEGRRRDGKRVLDLDYGRYPAGSGRGVVRATLVNRLVALAEAVGVAFRFASPVTAIGAHAGSAALRGVGKGTWDLVVVADGAHSPLRETMAPIDRTRTYDWSALWALVPLPGDWPLDVLQQRYHRGDRMAGILPVAQGRGKPAVGTFFWSLRHDAVASWRHAPLHEWKTAVLGLWPGLAPIVDEFRSHDDLHVATYRDVRPSRWHRGRVVLVGDAAHGTSPQLGNGVTLALGDAVVLARALARAPDVPDGLKAYERERRTAVRYYQWASRWLTPFFQSDGRILPWLRDAAMDPLCRVPILGRYMHSTLVGDRKGWLSAGLLKTFESTLSQAVAQSPGPSGIDAPLTDTVEPAEESRKRGDQV